MAFDPKATSAALAAAAEDAGELDGLAWVPGALSGFTVFVGEVRYEYDQTFNGLVHAVMTLYAATSIADVQQGQEDLQDLLAPTGLKVALEADLTLGGLVQTLRVTSASGPRKVEFAGQSYFGATWDVEVWG